MSGVDCMCQVWTVCVRCGLYVTGVDCMCQVWTVCVRCGLYVSGVDCMCQVRTVCDRCGLYVSHVLFACAILCRIIVLRDGQIVEFDTPNQLLAMKGVFHDMAKDAGLA